MLKRKVICYYFKDVCTIKCILLSDLPLQGQTPCTAHSALKKLIERLIQESLTLPLLRKAQEHPANPVDETDRTYEDLLATAIINKVS